MGIGAWGGFGLGAGLVGGGAVVIEEIRMAHLRHQLQEAQYGDFPPPGHQRPPSAQQIRMYNTQAEMAEMNGVLGGVGYNPALDRMRQCGCPPVGEYPPQTIGWSPNNYPYRPPMYMQPYPMQQAMDPNYYNRGWQMRHTTGVGMDSGYPQGGPPPGYPQEGQFRQRPQNDHLPPVQVDVGFSELDRINHEQIVDASQAAARDPKNLQNLVRILCEAQRRDQVEHLINPNERARLVAAEMNVMSNIVDHESNGRYHFAMVKPNNVATFYISENGKPINKWGSASDAQIAEEEAKQRAAKAQREQQQNSDDGNGQLQFPPGAFKYGGGGNPS